ncbi:MAG: L-serine ammonia-lyase, iron-sulfur-dependent, subunit alpha [Acidaminococcaceae bacterium]|nr:L-serine ammonia-lyase, iron-sulfur-dependent, subunit alpha [Acidaminococcaceae bacterium]
MNDKMLSLAGMFAEAERKKLPLTEYLLEYNFSETDMSKEEILAEMKRLLAVMEAAIEHGLTGVRSQSGLSGGEGVALKNYVEKSLLGAKAMDAVTFAVAAAESNAAMGRIVAAPTAGASGILPGVFFALKKHYALSEDDLAKGLVVAGSIGTVIAARASLAGALGGCQAECGSAAAMAAGAAVAMLGGSPAQTGTAVAIVFNNVLGLVCDPVGGLVEIPCIKRNGACALQAMLAADMALSGIQSFIPADEAIDAMKSVGDMLPCALRETAEGGFAAAPTAVAWTEKYFG